MLLAHRSVEQDTKAKKETWRDLRFPDSIRMESTERSIRTEGSRWPIGRRLYAEGLHSTSDANNSWLPVRLLLLGWQLPSDFLQDDNLSPFFLWVW